jgi:hypothetical protein
VTRSTDTDVKEEEHSIGEDELENGVANESRKFP